MPGDAQNATTWLGEKQKYFPYSAALATYHVVTLSLLPPDSLTGRPRRLPRESDLCGWGGIRTLGYSAGRLAGFSEPGRTIRQRKGRITCHRPPKN